MSLRKRLEKLELLHTPAARKVATRDLTGMDLDKLRAEVDSAINPADADLIEQIMALVAELAKVPWQNQTTKEMYLSEDGQEQRTPHFFRYWLWGLQAGSWRLPTPLPRQVLEGFCRLHGAVLFRCEDCLSALGNARLYERCPVCQGERISSKDLSEDPAWIYTPRERKWLKKQSGS